MSWTRIWAELSRQERLLAAQAHELSQTPVPDGADDAVRWLSDVLRVRPQFLRQMAPERRLEHLVRRDRVPGWLAAELLIRLHEGPRLDLMSRFFAACGFEHDGAAPRGDSAGVPLSQDALVRGLAAVQRDDPKAVCALLDCLESTQFPAWANLPQARQAQPPEPPDVPVPPPPPPSALAAPPPPEGAFVQDPHARGFTTLDHLLIDAALGATAGQVGALEPDSVQDLVCEVVALNVSRQQSWFHLGFLDVLQGRRADPQRPEANDVRRGWYLAGAVTALARRSAHAAIVELTRTHPVDVVRLLGPDSPAVRMVASLVFEAHVRAGALGEGVRLYSPESVVAGGGALAWQMLRAATDLLREYRAAEARPLLQLLNEAVRTWPEEDDPLPPSFLADLERRRAHALRLSGDLAGAREILERLLVSGASVHASRAHADLGLIASGHKALTHVDVPLEQADWPEKAAALRRGERHFLASVQEPEPGGAHGDYCLAVMHLCQGRYERARPHLEQALAQMQSNEAVYGPIGTLDKVRFYLAVCLTDALDAARAGMAVELLEQGLRNLKGQVPMPMLLHAFETLGAMDQEQVRVLVSKTGDILGDRLLAAVQRADALHRYPDLLGQLAIRMRDGKRTRRDRAADAESALAASRRAAHPGIGAEALDVLEELADDRSGRARLLRLLEDRERYDPAWTHVEARMARVRLLEVEARFDEAQPLLEELAHEALSNEGERGVPVARGYLSRIQDFGGRVPSDVLVARVEALAARESIKPSPSVRNPARGRILFVGGNETQEQYDQRLVQEFRSEAPEIELDFAHTGWGSNWGRELASIEGRVRQASAVVVMQFIRTLLGRHVRSLCGSHGRPWVACTGHGYASIRRSLQEAIGLVGR